MHTREVCYNLQSVCPLGRSPLKQLTSGPSLDLASLTIIQAQLWGCSSGGGGQGLHQCYEVRPADSQGRPVTEGLYVVFPFRKVEDETCLCCPVTHTV